MWMEEVQGLKHDTTHPRCQSLHVMEVLEPSLGKP